MQIIIRRKTLTTVFLIAAGLTLILIGWLGGFSRSGPGMEKPVEPGTAVTGEGIKDAGGKSAGSGNELAETADGPHETVRISGGNSVPESWLAENLETGGEFFVEYRMERDRVRGQQVEFYREIINNPNSSSDARQLAQNRLLLISQNIEREMKLENLIRAKGYKDAAVFLQDKSVTAIVQAKKLTDKEIAEIAEIIARGTGVGEQNVFVIAKM